MFFDETQLSDRVLDALYDMRFDKCTPIQEKCIPPILEGHDLLGVAQTGTGKTAAYLLPILSKLDEGNYPSDAINCVIMSPTRELAQQIDQQMQGFGYIMLQTVSSTFAINADTPPILAAWIPNIIFAFVAYFCYRKAPN